MYKRQGVVDLAAQGVDLADDVLRHGGGAVADQGALNALVEHALLGGDGDLLADDGVLALVGAVLGAIADGQGVHAGLAEELHRVHGIGIGLSLIHI